MVREMLQECNKMCSLDHPNVLSLTGVCLDGGTAPYIIMPFMANGSLLLYLKKHRNELVISPGNESEVNVYDNNIVCSYCAPITHHD